MPAPILPEWLACVVTLVLVFPVVVVALPVYLAMVRPDWIRCHFENDDRRMRRLMGHSDVAAACTRLTALGFRPLGLKVERFPLFGAIRSMVLVSVDQAAFASVFRVGRRLVLEFFTPFSPAAFVVTSDGRAPPFGSEDCIRRVLPHGTPEELSRLHCENVGRMTASGRKPEVEDSPESRLAGGDAYYRCGAVRRAMRRQVKGYWVFLLLALIAAGNLAWVLLGL